MPVVFTAILYQSPVASTELEMLFSREGRGVGDVSSLYRTKNDFTLRKPSADFT